MSAELYNNLRKAVIELRPDLAKEFDLCRRSENRSSKEAISAFLNKHFPLDGITDPPNWSDQLSSRIPDMLKLAFQPC